MSDDDLVVVRVDEDLCIAGGMCEMVEPDTFEIDDDTVIAMILGDGKLPRDRADEVIDRCPAGAISIVEDE